MKIDNSPRHVCRMPRRRGRWHHRIYICDCKTAWTAVYMQSEGSMTEFPPGGYYLWHMVKVTVEQNPTYLHG